MHRRLAATVGMAAVGGAAFLLVGPAAESADDGNKGGGGDNGLLPFPLDNVINVRRSMFFNIDADTDNPDDAVFQIARHRTGQTGGETLITLQEYGDVGIGTAEPEARLHVESGQFGVPAVLGTQPGGGNAAVFQVDGEFGAGILGHATSVDGIDTHGVMGKSDGALGVGVAGHAGGPSATGVRGVAGSVSGRNFGGFFESRSPLGTAVLGLASATDGINYGVRGRTNSPDGYAGYFEGDAYVSGSLGIGGDDDPVTTLHVSSGNDLSLTTHGYLVLGEVASANVAFDANEVQARNNGGPSTLFVNHEGGNVALMANGGGGLAVHISQPMFDCHVNGSAGKPGGGSWANSSDARLKKDVENLDGALDSLLALRGVTFEYLDPAAINELEGQRIGMIAQEVEEVFPDWVGARNDGFKTVTYRGFEALTVEALRELREEKDAEIIALRAEVAELRALVLELVQAPREE